MTNPSVEELAPDFDERVVVETAQQGDREALTALYEFYFPRVFRYTVARLGNNEDAEDVTNEIFLKIIDNIGGFSWRGLPFGAWVFRIARNEIVSFVRRQKHRGGNVQLVDTIEDDAPDFTGNIEMASTLQVVREAAEQLPEAQRQVIALRFGAGLTVKETASVLGKSENNVKVLQHKAVARLQKMVKDE
ncbi:MAG: sigma-70 family RNA polymerase sigma factor [Dehalococcoidia bacterium]|nr:sigma-70 family RNA polymerase sigma factor [Dehalococcoidia bacterium]MCA9824916.1 sigma-70 family RNA polymerase sigma factor [Dehalococcoidia bacterium]MCA9843462.1 sigma-70 family RNA polymerase sigma factor [Dehalococcoidia bacterium]MCA9854651.1 sigma-70 family RNA polymerase sigma factor [Dehalococcoidia bacterium]